MEKISSASGLIRTKSDQLVEAISLAMAGMRSPVSGEVSGGGEESVGGGTLSRKSSKSGLIGASPGRGSSSRHNNTHIRKSRSAQMKFDLDDLTSGAALSRASSASLGLSFSFTGFTLPPEDIADSRPFSDDDIRKFSVSLLVCVC